MENTDASLPLLEQCYEKCKRCLKPVNAYSECKSRLEGLCRCPLRAIMVTTNSGINDPPLPVYAKGRFFPVQTSGRGKKRAVPLCCTFRTIKVAINREVETKWSLSARQHSVIPVLIQSRSIAALHAPLRNLLAQKTVA
ncbi:hypothetical protein CDAR_11571 [Caerostris darwini]|uniref:Uncharacterized protein n=1 Tax=Caerostris darwini TaxID=1538125 RepID=A0AAV4RCE4_9ARAC|nr:hypothetical protein CDAR_11571 [Caerostris darwini]